MSVGIVGGFWTPKAAKNATLGMSELPSARCAQLLSELGLMKPCSSSLDNLMKQVGETWEQNHTAFELKLLEEEDIPEQATSLAVSLDGVLVPTHCTRVCPGDSRYEEASCGTVSLFDKDGQRLKTIQFGRMPERKKLTLKNQLDQTLHTVLKANPGLTLVKIADGARDNWDYLDHAVEGGESVIDFYHASQHLNQAFEALYGKASGDASRENKKYRHKLRHNKGGALQVRKHLEKLSHQKPNNKALRDQVTYFRNNAKKMKYAQLKSLDLPIGSGIVEAACKTLVTQRMKCSGMQWDYKGGQAVLSMRAANQSDWFDDAWELIEGEYIKNVIPLRKISRGHYEKMAA